ncbi:MAG TPA: hypothetical protein O0X18_04850 [Methanocorpusculum sp.]|nr:hypothetical protein [Methanocorpusculum sp.]
MRRAVFSCGLVILCAVLLVFAAGCVGEPPVPEDGNYFITIDPVPDQILGTAFLVSGTTNLPSGSKLRYEQIWDDWREQPIYGTPIYYWSKAGYISTTLEVERGNGTINVWRMPVDSSSYLYPKTYLVRVDALDLNYSAPRAAAYYNLTRQDGSILTPTPTPTPFPYWLTMDPVPDQIPGSVFTVSGTTNLPPGSSILFTHHRAVQMPIPGDSDAGTLSETVLVTTGHGTENIWQYTVNSSGFPDRLSYIVGVRAENSSPASGSYLLMHPGDTPFLFTPIPTPTYNLCRQNHSDHLLFFPGSFMPNINRVTRNRFTAS